MMRHGMATITRQVTGSLEAAQAVTGHKDQRMVQHYARMASQVQVDAVNRVQEFMDEVERGG